METINHSESEIVTCRLRCTRLADEQFLSAGELLLFTRGLAVVCLYMYFVYASCIVPAAASQQQRSHDGGGLGLLGGLDSRNL
jgi:hypothetical protein